VTGAPVGLQVTGPGTTPQFGVGYKLRPDVMLYASYSESFIIPPTTRSPHARHRRPRGQAQIGKGYEAA